MASSSKRSQPSGSQSKKRKHGEGDEAQTGSAVSVSIAESSTSLGPAWVNFPAIRPAKSTPFTIYRRDRQSDAGNELAKQQTVLAGETGDVEYFSTNRDLVGDQDDYYQCQYLPALYDPATNSLVVHPSAPTYMLSQRVKRLKDSNVFHAPPNIDYQQNMRKRNELGEAFGTKKAQSRIKAVERNKVDAGAQESSRAHLMAGIEEAAKVMPTAESIAADMHASRLIPPPNMETTELSQVYPLSVLIPPEEMAAIDVKKIIKADSDQERMELLPYKSSRWIEAKMRLAVNMSLGPNKEHLKILYYIACMRQFEKSKKALGNTETLVERMNGMPKVIIDGLIKRFTETVKGTTKPVVTAAMEVKLLAYQFALRLILENYASEVQPVADDLQMQSAKVAQIFKSLGCTVDLPTAADRERLGMSLQDARKSKRALLQAPPVFPKIKTGPPKRR